jgi:hypothetical protein
MKYPRVAVIAVLFLTGCSAPYSLQRPSTGQFASLTMVSSSKANPTGGFNGIKSVDGHTFSSDVGSTVFVKAGRHVVGYLCPGWIATDAGPTLTYEFNAGTNYVLDCDGTPSVRVAADSP